MLDFIFLYIKEKTYESVIWFFKKKKTKVEIRKKKLLKFLKSINNSI